MVTGGGSDMNLPKTPEVLINRVAKINSKKGFRFWFFMD